MLHLSVFLQDLDLSKPCPDFFFPPVSQWLGFLNTSGAEVTLAAGQANPSLFSLNISARFTQDCRSAEKQERAIKQPLLDCLVRAFCVWFHRFWSSHKNKLVQLNVRIRYFLSSQRGVTECCVLLALSQTIYVQSHKYAVCFPKKIWWC